jgi:hypothetical protein
MRPLDLAIAPWRVGRGLIRAAEDLHDLAERARREPDPVEEVHERLDALLAVGSALTITAETIVTGGRDLRLTGERLDGHTEELIDGGAELTAVAKHIADELEVVRSALPRVAETIEPLQGVARGVGKVSGRLSRG